MSPEDYLRTFDIPQKSEDFGPAARSSDLSEILFADLAGMVSLKEMFDFFSAKAFLSLLGALGR